MAGNGVAVGNNVRDAARLLERYYAPTRYPDALGGIDVVAFADRPPQPSK